MRGSRDKEKRRTDRISCRDVLLTYREETGVLGRLLGKGRESKPVPVRNISRDGACFLSKEKLSEGTDLSLTIDFGPHNPTVHLVCQVVHVEPGEGRYSHRVGVGFTRVSEKTWEVLGRLEDFCRRRDKKGTAWRLHHSTGRESRPGGALSVRGEEDEGEEEDKEREEDTGTGPAAGT